MATMLPIPGKNKLRIGGIKPGFGFDLAHQVGHRHLDQVREAHGNLVGLHQGQIIGGGRFTRGAAGDGPGRQVRHDHEIGPFKRLAPTPGAG
jgi:hypothetical protein